MLPKSYMSQYEFRNKTRNYSALSIGLGILGSLVALKTENYLYIPACGFMTFVSGLVFTTNQIAISQEDSSNSSNLENRIEN